MPSATKTGTLSVMSLRLSSRRMILQHNSSPSLPTYRVSGGMLSRGRSLRAGSESSVLVEIIVLAAPVSQRTVMFVEKSIPVFAVNEFSLCRLMTLGGQSVSPVDSFRLRVRPLSPSPTEKPVILQRRPCDWVRGCGGVGQKIVGHFAGGWSGRCYLYICSQLETRNL